MTEATEILLRVEGLLGSRDAAASLFRKPSLTDRNPRAITNVYIVSAAALEICKIGVSRDPPRWRMKAMHGVSPVPLRLYAYFGVPRPWGFRIEASARYMLAPYRSHGEWYKRTPHEVADAIRGAIRAASIIENSEALE